MDDTKVIMTFPLTINGTDELKWEGDFLSFEEIDYIRYQPLDFELIQAWILLLLVILGNGPIILLISKQVKRSF